MPILNNNSSNMGGGVDASSKYSNMNVAPIIQEQPLNEKLISGVINSLFVEVDSSDGVDIEADGNIVLTFTNNTSNPQIILLPYMTSLFALNTSPYYGYCYLDIIDSLSNSDDSFIRLKEITMYTATSHNKIAIVPKLGNIYNLNMIISGQDTIQYFIIPDKIEFKNSLKVEYITNGVVVEGNIVGSVGLEFNFND